jgi:polyhydroxyalkanoate synthesis regulator phasin
MVASLIHYEGQEGEVNNLMRKRIILGASGTVLFLAGILAGMIFSGGIPVFASSNTPNTTQATYSSDPTGYCQLYEQTLANQLGVSESKLESANSAALQAVINQMAKDGKISSQQKNMLEQALQQYSSQPCSHLNQLMQMAKHGANGNFGPLKTLLAGARLSIENAVAPKLGISQQTLDADLAAGQTIPQIAQAKHVSLSAVNQAYLSAVQTLLAQAVSKGYLTQDQSNALYSQVTKAVNNGHYPLLEGGHNAGPGQPGQAGE